MQRTVLAGLLLFVLTAGRVHAQPRDTAEVNRLNRTARQYATSDPAQTRTLLLAARKLADSLKYARGQGEALFNESLLYRLKEQNAQQLALLMQALALFQTIRDSTNIISTLAEIGLAHHQQGDFGGAAEYYNQALVLFRKMQDVRGEAFILRRMGTIAMEQRRLDDAERLYNQVLALEEREQNIDGLGNIYNNLGVLHFEKGDYSKALAYHRQAMDYLQRANNISRLPASYHNQGRVHLAMGNLREAERVALTGLPLAQQLDNRMAIVEAAELLYEINKAKKDYRTAISYLELKNSVRDSIVNVESALQFARLKALAETERQEKEIAYLKQEQQYAELRQWVLIGSIVFIGAAASLIVFYLRQSLRARKLALQKAEETHRAQQELARIELENKRLREEELKKDLGFRQKELVTYTLNLVQKNTLMENLREGIRELLSTTDKDQKIKLTKLIRLIDYSLETEKDWEEFKMYFEKVHHSFFDALKRKFPDLTQSDLKLCALISLNLSSKEMAELMGISPESVKMARHRLRKKLDIATEENLGDFIQTFKSI